MGVYVFHDGELRNSNNKIAVYVLWGRHNVDKCYIYQDEKSPSVKEKWDQDELEDNL